jgi:hypothetical protein
MVYGMKIESGQYVEQRTGRGLEMYKNGFSESPGMQFNCVFALTFV